MHTELEKERQEDLRKLQEAQASKGGGGGSGGAGKNWSEEEVQLLVKAVKLFPAGTVSRSEMVWQSSRIAHVRIDLPSHQN